MGDYLRLPEGALNSIIIGCEAEEETKETVFELVRDHAPGIRVRQANREPNKYRLTIED